MLRSAIFWGLILFASAENQRCSDFIPSLDANDTGIFNRIADSAKYIEKAKEWITEKFSSANQESKQLILNLKTNLTNLNETASSAFDGVLEKFRSDLPKPMLEQYDKLLLNQTEEAKKAFHECIARNKEFANVVTFVDYANKYFTDAYNEISVECEDEITKYRQYGTYDKLDLYYCAGQDVDSLRDMCDNLIESPAPGNITDFGLGTKEYLDYVHGFCNVTDSSEELWFNLQEVVDGIQQDK